jgi:hypothetical protein
MSKRKNKRKAQQAKRKAQQSAARTVIMEKKETAEQNEKAAREREAKAEADQEPSRWKRFTTYVKTKSSFTDWCIAAFTLVLAAAAIYQFIIMDGQLNVMRKDQRAWITVTTPTTEPAAVPGGPLSTTVTVTNTGKTPANNIAGNYYVEVVSNGDDPHFETTTPHTMSSTGVLIPNHPRDHLVTRKQARSNGDIEDAPFTEREKIALDNGSAWIAIHGIVFYEDVFKTKHWVRFCYWTTSKPGLYTSRGCTAYNSIDNQ